MKLYLVFIVLITWSYVNVNSLQTIPNKCRFAPLYTLDSIIKSNDSFINDIIYWEGMFHSNKAGINIYSGYTNDGVRLDYTTGIKTDWLHDYSAPSKESLHLGIIAIALNEFIIEKPSNYKAINYFHVNITRTPEEILKLPTTGNYKLDNAFTILSRKIKTYHKFNNNFPGYGGFHPWVKVNDTDIFPTDDTDRTVPGLDNGELAWSLYSIYNILLTEKVYMVKYVELGQLYKSYFQIMVDNAMTIFFDPPSNNIRAVVNIKDAYVKPTVSNYVFHSYTLGDPWEGELMVVFMDLFCKWPSQEVREQVWINKRDMLQSIEFDTLTNGTITVQKGFWFSSHEQWKYLMLDYQESSINRRVFRNSEKARTWFSTMKKYPGMYASVTDVNKPNERGGYISNLGIGEIAFQSVTNQVITPYASFPLFLVDNEPSLGLSWYHVMISGQSMQNILGSTESTNINGTEIASLVTWDSKGTTVYALLGGTAKINSKYLKLAGLNKRFITVIDREWILKFPKLNGESLPYKYPPKDLRIPKVLNDFTSCK